MKQKPSISDDEAIVHDQQPLGNDGTKPPRRASRMTVRIKLRKGMTTSRIQAWYQCPKNQPILAVKSGPRYALWPKIEPYFHQAIL
jgi:hypothetical protein